MVKIIACGSPTYRLKGLITVKKNILNHFISDTVERGYDLCIKGEKKTTKTMNYEAMWGVPKINGKAPKPAFGVAADILAAPSLIVTMTQ